MERKALSPEESPRKVAKDNEEDNFWMIFCKLKNINLITLDNLAKTQLDLFEFYVLYCVLYSICVDSDIFNEYSCSLL